MTNVPQLDPDSDSIARHCAQINACNQRGGRMLSVIDLIDAGTLTRDVAAYALAAIGSGASFMVGALPGGAGKTTVMGALLNVAPPGVELEAASNPATIARGLREPSPPRCYICHEIGPGDYYAYLWDAPLRRYFELAAAGHMLATNLHADTYEQARDQLCHVNRIPPDAFRRMHLIFFLAVEGTPGNRRRRIVSVWESDGVADHRCIVAPSVQAPIETLSQRITRADMNAARCRLDRLMASSARTLEAVRAQLYPEA